VADVYVGTSGYSFKDWVGNFYPAGTRDLLPAYAEHFRTVEVNYTYYRMPTAKTMASMVAKTPEDFLFYVKAHKTATHEADLSDTPAYLEALRPMQEADKLAGLLFQFPQSFKNFQRNREHLARVAEAYQDHALAVEFRDVSWDREAVYPFLARLGMNAVSVDEPDLPSLFPRRPLLTGDVAYLRLHSRNADKWYAGGALRYDYNYSDEEMREWIENLREVSGGARRVFIYFNNCHHGQAAENARRMEALLRESPLD
jgi:uncharacterized protein YecE (DUF72 family)